MVKIKKGKFKIQKCFSDSLNCDKKRAQFKIQKCFSDSLNCDKKRAQFKIQQTSFMLIGIALFLILVFLFWMSLKTRSLHTEATNAEQDKAILMAEYIAGMTEFSCQNQQYCIDTDKLLALKDIKEYKDFWPANGIKIRKLYPEEPDKECTISNYPDCNTYTIKSGGNTSVGTFVALCRQEKVEGYNKRICELGRIAIGYKIK